MEIANMPDLRPIAADGAASTSVLIVEDNRVNARLMTEMLKAGGYSSRVAYDGREGLEIVRDRLPELIITDFQMPGLDGIAMTKLLKADPATASIPVIAVTAHAMPEHERSAKEAGCAGYLSKPIRLQSFLAEIVRVLAAAHAVRT
jgi:two-component system cell cycle response regulator DivK